LCLRDKLLAVFPTGEQTEQPKAAKGGFIVSRPTYLPSSGVVVGEHPTWKGGAARGSAGQKEMVVLLPI
jgi:hypothetical protein